MSYFCYFYQRLYSFNIYWCWAELFTIYFTLMCSLSSATTSKSTLLSPFISLAFSHMHFVFPFLSSSSRFRLYSVPLFLLYLFVRLALLSPFSLSPDAPCTSYTVVHTHCNTHCNKAKGKGIKTLPDFRCEKIRWKENLYICYGCALSTIPKATTKWKMVICFSLSHLTVPFSTPRNTNVIGNDTTHCISISAFAALQIGYIR